MVRLNALSKLGLGLCVVYLAIVCICVYGANTGGEDSKGAYVLLQLPLALQMAALDAIGLRGLYSGLSWVAAYLLFVPLTLIFLYSVGSALGKVFALVRKAG
jgi:hypothetical protein